MFIERNKAGEIISAYTNPQPGKDLEFLKDGSKELAKFLASLEVY